MKPIWIVDDDASIRFVLEKALARDKWQTRTYTRASQVKKALEELPREEYPQVIITDIKMQNESGLDLLEHIKQKAPHLPVVIMTAFTDLNSAVSAYKGGAYEYLTKPFDINHALETIAKAANQVPEAKPNQTKQEKQNQIPQILGQAPAIQEIYKAIGKLSKSNATVLITGETGSGKELIAKTLHQNSPNKDGPFIAINTAAIPKDLLESELFGHEKGSFTGAQTKRLGRFEQASGGTLFLDEIGDMPLDMQTRLLRILSEGIYYRVGGHEGIKINVRIIAATHQPLEEKVQKNQFREDLYHRLNVIRLHLPPLRQRKEDIEALTKHFLQKSAKELNIPTKKLSPQAINTLKNYNFSGNIRELENICHWLSVMTPANTIEEKDLPKQTQKQELKKEPSPQNQEKPTNWEEQLKEKITRQIQNQETNIWENTINKIEQVLIQTALINTTGRKKEAAELLGIGRNTLTRKIYKTPE